MKQLAALTVTLILISIVSFSQNPVMLKDVFPGNNTGSIQNIVKTTGYTFFNEDDDDADADRSLFRTDGTPGGTIKLNLTYPGYISTKAEMLTPLGNKVVFAGDNFQGYGEIWASDGTQGGTVALERFQPINNVVPVVELKTMGSYTYYSIINKDAGGVNHAYLRRTDGTVGGTSLVYDFSTFTGVPQVVFLTPINNILYFIVYDAGGTGADQLWRSDGTNAGTYMVYNFTTANFVESFLMQAGNSFYMIIGSVVAGVRQNTLWKSDGTAGGTASLKLIGTGNTNTYPPFAAIGNTLYFAGVDGNGKELWQTDGTSAGTVMVADINPGAGSSNPLSFAVLNNTLYFSAATPTSGGELWKYSGGVASLVKDINPGANSSGPGGLTVSGNTIVFGANNGINGGELWITDGTSRNTVMVADINPSGNSVPNTFAGGSPVYFAANNGTNGFEVFKYDNNGDVLSGPRKFYVNDNSLTGDVFTTSVGNNNNNGSKAYPFATINYALSQVQSGDSIYVDAGIYAEQVTIDKGITIIGAGQNLTSVINPASPLVPPPGPFPEYALIQTTQNIGDVHISNLKTTNNPANEGHSILLQTGGSVKNCKIIDGGLGVYVRVESATKTVVVENNLIQSSVFAVAVQGSGMTASVLNNTLNVTNPYFSVGIWVGLDFGPIVKLTATGNAISNYVYRGIVGNSYNTVLTENSILGTGQFAIENTASPAIATCNWYGSSDQYVVASKISGAVTFSPWLVNGADNDAATIGFQPVPGSCAGKQLFCVNDNSLTGDIYTSAVGNDANNGSFSAPLATITAALAKAQPGDIVIVDAGNYTEQVNINKNITILGAGKGKTILNGVAGPITPFSNTSETGIIQTLNGLTDVTIDGLTIDGTNSEEQHGIFIQGGGRVLNCELRYVNDGFYFQYISSEPRTANGYNNYVHHINYVGALFAGNGMTATATNNVIDLNGAQYGMGFIAGYGGAGTLASLTLSNNTIINSNGFGMMIASEQTAQVHNNSITRATGNNLFIQNVHGVNVDATCNWYGTSDAGVIIPYITGPVTYTSWLSNGTDNDVANGFQPLPNVCNGRQNKFYVNDNSLTGDVFTSAVGNDANTGIPSAPLLTIQEAVNRAQAGDSIFVDAGYFMTNSDITLGKSVTLLGTNYQTSPINPANPVVLNPSRITESIVINHRFTIGANDIRIKGFYFDPASRSQIQQLVTTNDFDNIVIEKNVFSITSNITSINITGKQVIPLVTVNYSINDNLFVKEAGAAATTISVNAINAIQINNNSFTANNTFINNARVQSGIAIGALTGDIGISYNTSSQQNLFISGISAKKTTISFNNDDGSNRFVVASSINVNPNEVEITDNIVTNPRTSGGPVISYARSNGLNLSSPNIARFERNTITLNGTGLTLVAQALIAPTLDAASANTQVYIRNNKLTITGDFSSLSVPASYVSAIRFLNNSRYASVENNEMVFTATNYNSSNKFGIGILHSGLQPGTGFDFLNNKFSGFSTSIGVQNNGNGNNYGELPAGVVLNINYNSFTGDNMSINNGITGQSASATCNWYSSAAAQNFINKLSLSTVDIVPWLNNGTDNDPATGFQPVAGACDGYPTLITLDNYSNVTCNGAANGIINITVSYGKAPFTYTWTKDGDANFIFHAEDLTNLAPGTYHLSIVDGNGSNIYITDPEADGPGTITVTITEPTALTANANGTNVSCNGGNNGTASVTVGGGTLPYSYSWSNGSTTASISNLIAGLYTVTVTDGNGCTKTASYQVTQPALLTAVATGTSTSCANSASAAASGGVLPYSYAWSNGATTQSITSLPAGTYTVTVTDANGCQKSSSCTVTATEAFNPSASVVNVSCYGGSNGSITVTNANGVAPFQYSINGVSFQSDSTFKALAAGTYTITVKDRNGCTGFVTKTITQPEQLVVALGTVQSTCSGSSTGSISVNVTGGSPSYSYLWLGPNNYSSTQSNISGLAVGNYSLKVTDSKLCSVVLPVTVSAYPAMNVSAVVTNVTCNNANNGSIDLTVTGGTGAGFTYVWNTGATIQDLFNLGPNTNYKVTITDVGSGCILPAITYIVTEPAGLGLTLNSKADVNGCQSMGSIDVTGTGGKGGYQYKIDNGPYQSSGIFQGLSGNSAGISYTVWVKDINGCTFSKPYLIKDDGKDVFENNGNKNSATALVLGTTISAKAITGDIDFYKLNGTNTWNGEYTISVLQSPLNVTYQLMQSNGSTIKAAADSGATYKHYTGLSGNYFIRVIGGTSYNCYQLTVVSGLLTRSSVTNVQPEVTKSKDIFDVAAYPNPSNSSFNIKVKSSSEETMNLRVMDASGRLIEERKNNSASQVIKLGERYINGVYLVEIIQGNNRKTVRLVKM